MAKDSPKTSPEVAKLPMDSGGEQPVIIDLPDGQKLVVGNLAHGSVIEVATWRGTGRPDSRTSRLMLGMSSGAAAEEAVNNAKKSKSKPDSEKPSLLDLIFVGLKKVLEQINHLQASRKKKENSDIKSLDESSENTSLAVQPKIAMLPKVEPISNDQEVNVDEWLENLIKKTEAKASRSLEKAADTSKKSSVKKATSANKNVVHKAAPKKQGRR